MDDLKPWKPSADDEMTDAVMHSIVCNIADGNLDPELSRRLLQEFMYCTTGWNGYGEIPEPLIRLMRMAIGIYLSDPKNGNLERALGLIRPNHRPTEMTHRDHKIARDVLLLMLEGKTLGEAASQLYSRWYLSKGAIEGKWAAHKGHALYLEAATRAMQSPDKETKWTDSEKNRLREIYPGFVK